jgi:carbon storage regulator
MMLVLSRKKGQRVVIGDNAIVVMVVEILGDKVRLGFEADRNVDIHREEVKQDIDREGKKPWN